MDIFLSWSGDKSNAVAKALEEWLPIVIQSVEPFFSEHSIEAGKRWSGKIESELSSSNYGLICLTKENINAPWIQFESGALSKLSERSNVSVLLFDLNPPDLVKNPLSQFQSINPTKKGIFKLLESINGQTKPTLTPDRLKKIFEKNWPDLETEFSKIDKSSKSTRRKPEPTEMQLLKYMLDKQDRIQNDVDGLLSHVIGSEKHSFLRSIRGEEYELIKAIRDGEFDYAHHLIQKFDHRSTELSEQKPRAAYRGPETVSRRGSKTDPRHQNNQ